MTDFSAGWREMADISAIFRRNGGNSVICPKKCPFLGRIALGGRKIIDFSAIWRKTAESE